MFTGTESKTVFEFEARSWTIVLSKTKGKSVSSTRTPLIRTVVATCRFGLTDVVSLEQSQLSPIQTSWPCRKHGSQSDHQNSRLLHRLPPSGAKAPLLSVGLTDGLKPLPFTSSWTKGAVGA